MKIGQDKSAQGSHLGLFVSPPGLSSTAEAILAPPPPPPQPSVSTDEVVDRFLTSKRLALKEASLRSYADTLHAFARHYPKLPTSPEPIEAYLAHYGSENTGGRYVYTVLRLLYQFTSERFGLPNPMVKITKPRGKAKPPQHLTPAQARALLDAIEGDRERGLVYCLFGLGLRLAEARRLRVADIGQDTILVRGKERVEPMPLISEIRDSLLKLVDSHHPEQAIFRGRQGVLSDSQIQNIIKGLFHRAGISGVRPSPHTLRHSRGVISNMAGLDTYSARRLLRHTTTQMTDRYSELNLGELRGKEERFNPLRVLASLDGELGKKPDFAQFEATELLPQLLDQLEALGETARQLKQALGSNGHKTEKLAEISQYLEQQANK